MKSRDRLLTMSKEIGLEDRVVDIGSDHGYLPLLLLEEKGCTKVIVTDISPRSLNKAKKNIEKAISLKQKNIMVNFRLGNGLEVLSRNEANIAVIGGMGGLLISEILTQQIDIALSFDKIIMQPRKNQGELRYWLYSNGFTICNEHLAKEGRVICEVIVAEPSESQWDGPLWSEETKICYQVPSQILKAEEQELVASFLAKKLDQERTVEKALGKSKNLDSGKKEVIVKRIQYLENLIIKFESSLGER